jgi:basic membrane lipoprotein Med (substrate-binding protein (PBP1-ABC) superfamily)
MRKIMIATVAAFAFAGLAACGESAADKAAETQADALEAEAAATPNEAQEKALNTEADRIEQQAGNADGGMTASNTPSTTPPGEMTAPPAPAPAH